MSAGRMLRVLIVDDEPLARQRIEDLLRHEPAVTVVGSADSGPRAVEAIRALRPDLVFLDVQMPGKTGLDVVREIGPEAMPATIFVTAFDKHALEAFQVAAVDYLVKPFDDERFEQAFARARRRVELEDVERLKGELLAVLGGQPPALGPRPSAASGAAVAEGRGPRAEGWLERIPVESRGKVRVVPVGEIDYVVASGPYAELHVGDRRHLIREAMQTLEDRLDPAKFIRIHRSVIVRIDLIDTLLRSPGGDYEVQMKNGAKLRVSRSRREELERRLGLT
ncbi:MAG TPA: LytTR family DNA-binding domain-containing protein [Gemmatimonadaceae bacterium]|nr:LytTR family DNA-binding domain-containing protein [Gemmatimonadaceae bacterium]